MKINIERILNPKFAFTYPIKLRELCSFDENELEKTNVENNIFYLNSKCDSEGNLFYKLWRKKFVGTLTGGNKAKESLVMDKLSFPGEIVYRDVYKDGQDKRVLEMNFSQTLSYMLGYLMKEKTYNFIEDYDLQNRENNQELMANYYENFELFLAQNIKDKLIYTRNCLKDIRKNGENSPSYKDLNSLFNEFNQNILDNSFLDRIIKQYSDLIFIVESIIIALKNRNKQIINQDLLECIEEDKFLLIFARKMLLDLENRVKAKDVGLYHAICLRNYIEETSSIKGYNPIIVYFNGKKKVSYSYKKFIEEYSLFLKNNQEKLPFLQITDEELDTLNCSYNAHEVETLCKVKFEEKNIIEANWEKIRPGELLTPRRILNGEKKEKCVKTVEETDILRRMMLFEKLGYRSPLLGKGAFSGYVGFIFDNGLVVFEKFYEDEEKTKIAKENATYIMQYDNFIELSKLTKPEIMDYIKRTDNKDVQRKYHNDTWEIRMKKLISGKKYTEEIKRNIDLLLGVMELSKRMDKNE